MRIYADAGPAKPSPSSKTRIADLDEEPLKAAIEAITPYQGNVTPAEIGALLSTEILTSKSQPNRDWTTIPTVITLTLDYDKTFAGAPAPADRIDQVRVDFSLVDGDNTKITSWSRVENKRRKTDLATLSFSQSNDSGLTPGLTTLSPDLATLGGSLNLTRGLSEALTLREDQIALYGGLTERGAYFVETGAPLLDLHGVTSMTVTLKLADYNDGRVFGIESVSMEDSKPLALAGGFYKIPDPEVACTNDVRMKINYDIIVRHVVKGGRTFFEGDDIVNMVRVTNESKIRLPKMDVEPSKPSEGEPNFKVIEAGQSIPKDLYDVRSLYDNGKTKYTVRIAPLASPLPLLPPFFRGRKNGLNFIDFLDAKRPANDEDRIDSGAYSFWIFDESTTTPVKGRDYDAAIKALRGRGPILSEYGCEANRKPVTPKPVTP